MILRRACTESALEYSISISMVLQRPLAQTHVHVLYCLFIRVLVAHTLNAYQDVLVRAFSLESRSQGQGTWLGHDDQ